MPPFLRPYPFHKLLIFSSFFVTLQRYHPPSSHVYGWHHMIYHIYEMYFIPLWKHVLRADFTNKTEERNTVSLTNNVLQSHLSPWPVGSLRNVISPTTWKQSQQQPSVLMTDAAAFLDNPTRKWSMNINQCWICSLGLLSLSLRPHGQIFPFHCYLCASVVKRCQRKKASVLETSTSVNPYRRFAHLKQQSRFNYPTRIQDFHAFS